MADDEIKGLSEAAKAQKAILDAIPPDQIPEPPPDIFSKSFSPDQSQSAPQSFTTEDGTRVEVREVADLPEDMDERRITHEILEELRDLHAFLRERMGEDA